MILSIKLRVIGCCCKGILISEEHLSNSHDRHKYAGFPWVSMSTRLHKVPGVQFALPRGSDFTGAIA